MGGIWRAGARLAAALATATAVVCASVSADDGVPLDELPVVPAAELDAAKQAADKGGSALAQRASPAAAPQGEAPGGVPHDGVEAPHSASTVKVTPGINEIVPVAIGHLNRIVTPFESPQVKTVNSVTTRVEGNVVYAATTSSSPVTMYITDGDDESLAISLTLYPQAIPPHEVRLELDPTRYRPAGVTRRAERWERDAPYVEGIKRTLRLLALGELPDGYVLGEPKANEAVACGAGLEMRTGQRIEGASRVILVAVARNNSGARAELAEARCTVASGRPVLAVAAWPRVWLEPGGRTEVFVVLERERPAPRRVPRPSLIGEVP